MPCNRGKRFWCGGGNGAGKSTLLRILAGLLSPADGTIAYGLTEEQPPPLHFLGHTNAIKSGLSVEQNIQFWAEFAGVDASAQDEAIDATLDAFNLDGLRDLPARYLSAGQKRRLALARLVASPAPALAAGRADDRARYGLGRACSLPARQAAHRAQWRGMAVIATHRDLAFEATRRLRMGLTWKPANELVSGRSSRA